MMMKLSYMIVLSLFVEFDKIDATKSSFCRFLSKLTKTLLYVSTWQKVGAVFVTFCRFLSIFVTNFPSEPNPWQRSASGMMRMPWAYWVPVFRTVPRRDIGRVERYGKSLFNFTSVSRISILSFRRERDTVIKFARPGLTRQLHLKLLKTDGC